MFQAAAGTILFWALGAALLRITVIQSELCPAVTVGDVHEAAVEAGLWLERAGLPDGRYTYEYDLEEKAVQPGYNVVRHAGVTMSLYQLAAAGESRFLAAADWGLDYMEENLLRGPGWAAFQDPRNGRTSLGANSLLLAALSHRRLATGDDSYDLLMSEVGTFLMLLQRDDGSMLSEWDPETVAPRPNVTSKYATGEAFWAFSLMDTLFPAEGWESPADLTAFYLATERDEAEDFAFPPWADQWAAYGLSQMPSDALTDVHTAYARSLAERFGFLMRVESRRRDSWLSDVLHGRQARAAGLGTWVEGLGSLWLIADRHPALGDLKDDIRERAVCGAGLLVSRQQLPAVGEDLVGGAWFTEGVTRMDDQQHALSGLLMVEQILKADSQ
ncbi:MAG TPA: hypothetical protein QGF35_03840 [Dehalococcoidia bacterium]|nr:hypothetical protein [Dehalococcoidia bacterium]